MAQLLCNFTLVGEDNALDKAKGRVEKFLNGLGVRVENSTFNTITTYNQPIEELGLSARACNILHRWGVENVGHLTQCTEHDLENLNMFGRKSIAEIKQALEKRGLSLMQRYTPLSNRNLDLAHLGLYFSNYDYMVRDALKGSGIRSLGDLVRAETSQLERVCETLNRTMTNLNRSYRFNPGYFEDIINKLAE